MYGVFSKDTPIAQVFGLGVDLARNVYVSEYTNSRVAKWSPNATYGIRVAGDETQGNSPTQSNVPTPFYVDPVTATLYIPNQGSHYVTKWLAGSTNSSVAAGICGIPGTNETLLISSACVTFDKYGNMYVIDSVNGGRVIMFCPNALIGKPIVTSGLSNPISIAVDTHLTLYVID